MAGEVPKDEEDVKLEEYELLADGWVEPNTKRRFKRGDTVKVDADHAEHLLRLGSIGKKGTVKESEEGDKKVAEKAELHQKIHMGMVDPAAKDEENRDDKADDTDAKDENKSSGGKVTVRPTNK